jgi:bifunctional ADP-heptose synthase (sugar kinase/adenylyltransferase)
MYFLNEGELREITKEHNLVKGARKLISLGPSCVIVKRGEYGVFMMNEEELFLAPAFPLEDVFDPTGAVWSWPSILNSIFVSSILIVFISIPPSYSLNAFG